MMKVKAKRRKLKLKLNVGLLRKVQRAMLAKPDQVYMSRWFDKGSCGTTACIAGWAIYLAKQGLPLRRLRLDYANGKFDPETQARKLLGLSGNLASKLFIRNNWPWSCRRSEYSGAKEAINYIDYFIKKHGPRSRKVK